VIRLLESSTGEVRPLETRKPGELSLYVCGPTVYDLPHIGHGRHLLVWDVFRRYLTWRGVRVRHVSNVTDIDDKIIERARVRGIAPEALAAEQEAAWWAAADDLGVLRPDATPHATAYVPAMIELVGELLGRGVAYRAPDGVYLDVGRVPGYGLLARQPLESLRAGAGAAQEAGGAGLVGAAGKRSPLDFALWKAPKPGEPTWLAPFGSGRPGWHTECVAMALDLLGPDFDLHTGGLDLAFPHHENERAQAVALGVPFARRWAHHAFVLAGTEKMSHSLANFTTLTALLAESDPRAYRLLVVRSHYRQPLQVTPEVLAGATEALARFDGLHRRLLAAGALRAEVGPDAGVLSSFVQRMDDDLDTAGAVGGLFEATREANAAADRGENERAQSLAVAVVDALGALGLEVKETEAPPPAVAALVAEREAARAARDFATADRLRERLRLDGWEVEDSPVGPRLHRRRATPG